MAAKKVIIIGAGLAGLATGIYARTNGYDAQIFEHGNQPGGVSATWKRKGFMIDGGIHFYMGYRPGQPVHRLYRELGIDQADQYHQMDIYARFLDPASDRRVDLVRDLDRFGTDLKAVSPVDAGFIDEFISAAKTFKNADFITPLAKPPELSGFWDTARMMISMRKTLRYYTGRYNQPMFKFTQGLNSSWLRQLFEHIFLPEVPVWFVLFLLGMLADGNIALRADGSAGFAKALEKRFTDLGGQISYQATVEEVLVENDQAIGIRLSNSDRHHADRVISAADGFATIFEFLDGRYTDKDIRERYRTWPLIKPVVMISYGLSRELPDGPWMVVLKSTHEITAGHLVYDWLPIRLFNYGPVFSPPGKTVIQVMAETAWQPWHDLRDDIQAYRSEKELLATQVLKSISAVWPGIDTQVDMVDVATPYTYWRYTLNRQGAYEGFNITPETINTKIKRTLPGLRNFYMAGQWTTPGGGVVPSLMTGRHAVMLLCNDDAKPFINPAK
jgi:phytoene dehydrogenase-like protein